MASPPTPSASVRSGGSVSCPRPARPSPCSCAPATTRRVAGGRRLGDPVPPARRGRGEMWPAVSADGTRVGYVGAGDRALYRVLDLRTGHRVDFPDVGERQPDERRSLPQRPAVRRGFPDAGLLLARRCAGGRHGVHGDGCVADARARAQRTAHRGAGTRPHRRMARRRPAPRAQQRGRDRRRPGGPRGVGPPDGSHRAVRHRHAERGRSGGESGIYGQWGASIRGDGTLWLRGSDDRENPDGSVTSTDWAEGFALPSLDPVDLTGRRVTRPAPVEVENQVVQGAGWAGSRLVGAGDVTGLVVLAGDGTGSHPVVDDAALRWDTAVWAQDALDGGPTWSPFGTSTSWFAWRWKELALAALAVGLWRSGGADGSGRPRPLERVQPRLRRPRVGEAQHGWAVGGGAHRRDLLLLLAERAVVPREDRVAREGLSPRLDVAATDLLAVDEPPRRAPEQAAQRDPAPVVEGDDEVRAPEHEVARRAPQESITQAGPSTCGRTAPTCAAGPSCTHPGRHMRSSVATWGTPVAAASRAANVDLPDPVTPTTTTRRWRAGSKGTSRSTGRS